MKEIDDLIKEGFEGFFITQYSTIFKLAFATQMVFSSSMQHMTHLPAPN